MLSALLMLGMLLAAACSSSPDETPLPPTATPTAVVTPTTTPTATPQPTPTSTAPPATDLTQGGVARIAVRQIPAHQDVHQSASQTIAAWGAGLEYSRLFRLQRGPNVPMPSRIPECDLCESWRQTGPATFEFQIRDDAAWPNVPPLNGRQVTAHDVAYSLNRLATPGWANEDLLSTIEAVEAVDDQVLRIKLTGPDAEIFERLADGRAVIVAGEAVEINGDLIDGPTIGSGPWVIEELHTGGAVIEANADYYGARPDLDGLSIQFVPEASTRAAGVRANILDIADTTWQEAVDAVERFPELQVISVARPASGVELALNTMRVPLSEPDLRSAILLSWDPATMIETIWDSSLKSSVGLQLPDADWLVDFDTAYSDLFNDVDRARELVSGLSALPERQLTIRVGQFGDGSDEDRFAQTAESLAAAMGEIGIQAHVESVTTRVFADEVWLEGDFDIFIGAPPPVASLNAQLFGIYHSDGPWNTTGFADPELDDLIDRQAVEMSRESRAELLRAIQGRIMQHQQRFYPVEAADHWLMQPRVRGAYPDTGGASTDFLTKLWLSPG